MNLEARTNASYVGTSRFQERQQLPEQQEKLRKQKRWNEKSA